MLAWLVPSRSPTALTASLRQYVLPARRGTNWLSPPAGESNSDHISHFFYISNLLRYLMQSQENAVSSCTHSRRVCALFPPASSSAVRCPSLCPTSGRCRAVSCPESSDACQCSTASFLEFDAIRLVDVGSSWSLSSHEAWYRTWEAPGQSTE